MIVTDPSDSEASSELQKWFHEPEKQKLRARLESYIDTATAVMMGRAYEGAIQNVDVMIRGRKKRISFRGYSHRVTWEKCDVVEFCYDYGISSAGRLVCKARLVGVPDRQGDYILEGTTFDVYIGQTYFTSGVWYAITINDIPDHILQPLIDTLDHYVSD